ncbi:MAG TPA: hypothetical protein PK821_07405 [Victivallales bacterium]|nr:hypothetical protein [Victivallales bacterium]
MTPSRYFSLLIKEIILSVVLSLASIAIFANPVDEGKSMSPEVISLLERARKSPGSESWAKLEGKINHRKKNSETIEHSIYVGIRFTPLMIFAQVLVDGKEDYNITQNFSPEAPTIIKKGPIESKIMEGIGIRPEELTLSFMYWEAEAFLGNENFKSGSCAKIALRSPSADEKAVVFINREYAFPLKVEWFKDGHEKPSRTMEVSSFKKENNYWFVDEIIVYGPGWKSKISFNETKAGAADVGIPEDLFRK